MNQTSKGMITLILAVLTLGLPSVSEACTRILYETGTDKYVVGRSMDWNDFKMVTDGWIFPRGMSRDGGAGSESVRWNSKYGSVIISIYEAATVDGMNEKGLVGNVLYLAESDYGDPNTSKPKLSLGAWLQYILDNYESVDEVVKAMSNDPFTMITTKLPNGREASGHLAISDRSGDSAIFEYLNGKLNIHHNSEYKVMTNSPVYDQQLALNTYWNLIGGNNFLPGTISAADRFVRASYALKSSPKFKDSREAIASVFSQIRAVSVPLGMSDKEHPNIASTLWRSVIDNEGMRYYFDSAINPSVVWIDFANIDLSKESQPKKLTLSVTSDIGGDISSKFKAAKPFKWLAP